MFKYYRAVARGVKTVAQLFFVDIFDVNKRPLADDKRVVLFIFFGGLYYVRKAINPKDEGQL